MGNVKKKKALPKNEKEKKNSVAISNNCLKCLPKLCRKTTVQTVLKITENCR